MKGRLVEQTRGLLWIWEQPKRGVQYIVGVDTAAGIRGGDYCVAEVIEAESLDQVAEMRGLVDPTAWGRKCARIAWHFNEAMLGYETHPSAHGLTAARSSLSYGYQRLYRSVPRTKVHGMVSDRLGWQNSSANKVLLIDRIAAAIADGALIRSRILLQELLSQKYDDSGRLTSVGHDDCVIAYGVALCVRDDAYRRGEVKKPPPRRHSDPDLDPRADSWHEKSDQPPPRPWDGT